MSLLVGVVSKDKPSMDPENPDTDFWLRCTFFGPFNSRLEVKLFMEWHKTHISSNCEYRFKNLHEFDFGKKRITS